jgi:hypothetical protein
MVQHVFLCDRLGMRTDQITDDLSPEAQKLKREYRQIILKASKLLEIDIEF